MSDWKSNLEEYAERELQRAFPDEPDSMQLCAMENVMELIRVFSEQGHSGTSAPYVLRMFYRLASWKPLSPLTGDEDEWAEPWGGKNTQQNKRCSSVFRENFDNSTAEDIDGRKFVDKQGFVYSKDGCSVPIRFPYDVPEKPEYVYEEDDHD